MSAIECIFWVCFYIIFSLFRCNFKGIIVRCLCAFLDAINVTARSLYNSFEVIELGLIDLFPSLEVTIKCFFKFRFNNICSISHELFIVSLGGINLLVKATHAFSECWAATLCNCNAFAQFFTNRRWVPTVEHIHLTLEDALLKFIGITLSIDGGESVPFSPGIYPWFNVFAVIDINLSSCSSNNMVKINPVLFHCLLSGLFILTPKGPGLVENF